MLIIFMFCHRGNNGYIFSLQQLLEDMKDIEPLLAAMTEDGEKLAELAPGDAGFKVEDTLAKDRKRFEAINDAVQAKADKYRASKLKNAEVRI